MGSSGLLAVQPADDGMDNGESPNSDMDPSLAFNVGCSKELGFDGKLWFEPYVGMTMPGNDMDGHLGLGTSFRFCF